MTAGVHAEEQIDRATSVRLSERLIESLISGISGAPNFILQRLVHVIFRVGFNDEEASL